MVGTDQPEDLRCPCTTKFAEVTDKEIIYGCRGCDDPLLLPFAVLARGKAALIEYLSNAAEEALRAAAEEASTEVNLSKIDGDRRRRRSL